MSGGGSIRSHAAPRCSFSVDDTNAVLPRDGALSSMFNVQRNKRNQGGAVGKGCFLVVVNVKEQKAAGLFRPRRPAPPTLHGVDGFVKANPRHPRAAGSRL